MCNILNQQIWYILTFCVLLRLISNNNNNSNDSYVMYTKKDDYVQLFCPIKLKSNQTILTVLLIKIVKHYIYKINNICVYIVLKSLNFFLFLLNFKMFFQVNCHNND